MVGSRAPHASELLNSEQVCQRTGFTYRELDYWIRRGVLPNQPISVGSGIRRAFDKEDVAALRRVRRLLDRIEAAQSEIDSMAAYPANWSARLSS